MKRRALALALSLGCVLRPASARAQVPSPSAPPAAAAGAASEAGRAEAAKRFDRGLQLFNDGDSAGALAEFRRAYELLPNVVVLYNTGLVYAKMGRAVEATEALQRVLDNPGGLSAERLGIARKTHDEQAARIAEIAVLVSVGGAAVEVDGLETGKAPLAQPLRVTGGTHVISAVSPGFAPLSKEVTIAGGEKQSLQLDLVAMQGRMAHVAIKTHLPGARVFADDQAVGVTPLPASVPLGPGNHRIEMRRPGYTTARSDIALGDGATGEVTLEPEEDRAALAELAGTLALELPETEAVISVDGGTRGVYTTPLRLAPGPHRLLVERADFEPFGRDVSVETGRALSVRVILEPTPEYRAQFVSRAQSRRTWAYVSLVGGVVLIGGGVGLVAYDAGQRRQGRSALDALDAQSTRGSMEICDPGTLATTYDQLCAGPMNAANTKIANANTADAFGWSAIGVGGAAVVTGLVLLFTSDDPHAYDRPAPAGGAGALSPPTPTFFATRGGGGIGLTGAF
jgi:hypothetical protein